MGRAPGAKNKPKEETQVSTESDVIVSDPNGNVAPKAEVKCNQMAIGWSRVEKDGELRYVVYKVHFDLETNTLGSVEVVEKCIDTANASYRFEVLRGTFF